MRAGVLGLVAAFAALPGTLQADGFIRCGSQLIRTGDVKIKVLDACGEPDLKDVVSGSDEPRVEVWTYRGSSRQLIRVVRFRGNRVVAIELEPR